MRLLSSLRPGPGVGPTVAIGEELGLQVNAQAAGKGKVSCVVVQPDGSEVEAEVVENEDGTFDIFYTAPAPGSYVIYVRFGGENIPRSPFKVMVSLLLLVLVQLLGLEVWSGAFKCRNCLAVGGKTRGPCVLHPFSAHNAFIHSANKTDGRVPSCLVLIPPGGGQRVLIFPLLTDEQLDLLNIMLGIYPPRYLS